MNLNFDQNKKKPPKIKETHFAAVTLSFVCCSFLVNTYSRFIKLHIYKNFQFKPHLWWSGGWCTRRAATRWGTGWTAWWSWCHWRWRGTRAPPPAPPGYFSWVSLLHPSWRLLIILSRCHNWRIIALKSKGWSLEELNQHSKATQFLLSISWIQIRVPLKPHNCCILAELSTRTRDKRWWWHIISVSQIIFPRLKKI